MPHYRFHFQAAEEYFDAVRYYLTKASPIVAAALVNEVEASIQAVLTTLTTWPVIDESQTRRFLLKRFPYALYYRVEENDLLMFYAVMHFSRMPEDWRNRLE